MFNKIISFEKIILFFEGVTCFGTSLIALSHLNNKKKNIDYDYIESLSKKERKKYINRYDYYDDW